MNNIIKETNNLMKVQEKVEVVFEEIDNQVKSYNFLEKENNRFSIINTSSNDSFSLKYSDDMYNAFKSAYLSYQNKICIYNDNILQLPLQSIELVCLNRHKINTRFQHSSTGNILPVHGNDFSLLHIPFRLTEVLLPPETHP